MYVYKIDIFVYIFFSGRGGAAANSASCVFTRGSAGRDPARAEGRLAQDPGGGPHPHRPVHAAD